MKLNKTINGCSDCDNEEIDKECTINLDTSCIFYKWKSTDRLALSCLGLTAGTDLSTIIETIDEKLCEFSAFNLEGYDLACITDDYDIYSFKDFAEAISKEICTIKGENLSYKLDTINANLAYINKPKLEDTCVGYSSGDTIQTILQKTLDKICEIDAARKVVVSSPNITVQDSDSIDLTVCGEKDHTIKAEVKIATVNDNRLKVVTTGLYVPQLTDADIGLLLDRINSVPALKEKLCNICSFNQGVGGSSKNARICQCELKIASVAKYNGNNYSVILNTVDLGIAPYHWEVRNSLNYIVASGDTGSANNALETFELPASSTPGTYTVRYTSKNCNCTDVKSFLHSVGTATTIAPKIINAIQECDENKNTLTVYSNLGSSEQVTIIVRDANNAVLHTRTNNLTTNEFDITINGVYLITAYDSTNQLISSPSYPINFTCVGTVIPEDPKCVTYNVTNDTNQPITAYYNRCDFLSVSAIIEPESNATICMIRDTFIENDNLVFTEISDTCDAICSFTINNATVVCTT